MQIRKTIVGSSIEDKPLFSVKEEEVIGIDQQIENAQKRLTYIRSQADVNTLPLRWRTVEFDKSIPGCEIAEKFVDNFPNGGRGIIFIGDVGRGKTHLAGAIARNVIEMYQVPVLFKSYAALLDDIKRNFDEDRREIDRIVNSPLVVIDDLGQEKQSEWNKEVLFKIVNGRYENMLPMIITTNCTVMALRDNIGEPIFSRLYEMCDAVKVNGKDHRIGGKE